jgi:hypothetical protein
MMLNRFIPGLCALLMLPGCLSSTPLVMPPDRYQASARKLTTGTAKDIFARAETLARKWSPQAEAISVRGTDISPTGLNEAATGRWHIQFIAADKPGQMFQVEAHSSRRQLATQTLSAPPAAVQPLEVRAWGLDSSLALIKARRLSTWVTGVQMELTMSEQERLIWTLSQQAPHPVLRLDAMNGQVVTPMS